MFSSNEGIVAIFGPASLRSGAMVPSICTNMEIPHLQVSWNPKVTYSHQTVLNFYPDHHLFSQGLATIIRHMQWRSYVIIYEDNESLAKLQEVLKIVSVNDEPVMVRQIGEGPDYRPLLKEVKNLTVTQVIIDCSTDKIIDILQQDGDVNMLNFYYSYFFTSLDAHTLDFSILKTNANISVIRLVDPDNPYFANAVRDWEQGESNSNRYIDISTNKVKVS